MRMIPSQRCNLSFSFLKHLAFFEIFLSPPATNRLLTLNSGIPPLIVAPAERFFKASQQANVVLKQNTLLFVCSIVNSPACEVLGKDALFEAGLQVPVAPLLHLLVRQPHVDRWDKLLSIAGAPSQRRLVLPVVAIILLSVAIPIISFIAGCILEAADLGRDDLCA